MRSLAKLVLTLSVMVGLISVSQTFGSSAAYAQAVISNVQVIGNRRVETGAVVSYLKLQRGDRYNALAADDSFKELFATGLFSDVKISMRGSTLVVEVEENPLINKVAFEGNRKVTNNTLASEIESRERAVLTRTKVQNDVQRILVIYRRSGRFAARVEPKIIQLPQNRVNLVFEIDEGDKTEVSRINFIGNQAFSDRDLRDEITTGQSGLLSFIKSDDVYDPDRLAADQELLRRFYLRNGYADFNIVSAVADLDREKNAFFITITVDEGQKYRFGDIEVISNVPNVDSEELRSVVTTYSGDTYNIEEIDNSLEAITIEVSNLGYAFAQVRPRGNRDAENGTINITYFVEEGPRAYVERINIRGNTRTHDEVIRREFDFVEGDAFNRVLLDRAERRLNALNFFEKVEITREPGSARDRVIINVAVEEKSTGNLSLGAGFSTNDGVIGDISISERNLLGRGQFVRLGLNVSGTRQDIDFSFTEPYFLGRRLAAGIDLFSHSVEFDDTSNFSRDRIGGGVRLGFILAPNWSFTGRYQFLREEITIDDEDLDDVSLAIREAAAEGEQDVSLLGYTLRYDTIDNRNDPKNGFFFSFSQDLAGVGGDVNYLRTVVEGRVYHEIAKGYVGLIKLQGGHIQGFGGDDVRILDAFFKGGETIRGFDRSGIGPRDAVSGDALGGKLFASATAEVQFPLPWLSDELGIRGAVFADAATLYDTDIQSVTGNADASDNLIVQDDSKIRSSVGASILWNSPLGPLRADFAHVLSSAEFDNEQSFRFGASTQF